jgi:hypothetical protein
MITKLGFVGKGFIRKTILKCFVFLVEGISREARKKRYSEMPPRINYKKKLSGCKIPKCKKIIIKQGV